MLKYDNGLGFPEVFIRLRLPNKYYSSMQPGLTKTSMDLQFSGYSGESDCTGELFTVTGPVVVSKLPVLYPGDLQLCMAAKSTKSTEGRGRGQHFFFPFVG